MRAIYPILLQSNHQSYLTLTSKKMQEGGKRSRNRYVRRRICEVKEKWDFLFEKLGLHPLAAG